MPDDADAPPRSPPGTPLLTDRPAGLPPIRPVVALRVIEDAVELPLVWSDEKCTLSLGSAPTPTVDVSLPAPHVSRHHATLHLRGTKLAVVDANSRNGLYLRGKREPEILVGPGDVFEIADRHLLVLDEALRALRPHVQRALGYEAHQDVDLALVQIATGEPLLLLGRTGCDQAALARAIHQACPRRERPFVEVVASAGATEMALLENAWGGTAFVDLRTVDRATAPFVAHLFAASTQVRPIIASATYAAVETALGKERARGLPMIVLPPLSERPADVPRIFDELFVAELGSTRTVAELGPHNVAALIAHPWRDEIAGIRRVLTKVHARIETGSTTAAAERLGVTRQALAETLAGLGLVFEHARRRR